MGVYVFWFLVLLDITEYDAVCLSFFSLHMQVWGIFQFLGKQAQAHIQIIFTDGNKVLSIISQL